MRGMYLASSTPPLLTLSLVMPSLHLLELTKKNFVCQVGLNILLNRDILYPSLIILLIFLAHVYLSRLPSFGSMPRNDVVGVQDDDKLTILHSLLKHLLRLSLAGHACGFAKYYFTL